MKYSLYTYFSYDKKWRKSIVTRERLIDFLAHDLKIKYIVDKAYFNGNTELKADYAVYIEDLNGKTLDIQNMYNEILKKASLFDARKKRRLNVYKSERHLRDSLVYRYDPIPYVSKRRSNYYRNIRKGRLLRQLASKELYFTTIKESDNEIKSLWCDDRIRQLDRSWKSSYKIKKQYMKHLNRHINTCYIDKRLQNNINDEDIALIA